MNPGGANGGDQPTGVLVGGQSVVSGSKAKQPRPGAFELARCQSVV